MNYFLMHQFRGKVVCSNGTKVVISVSFISLDIIHIKNRTLTIKGTIISIPYVFGKT